MRAAILLLQERARIRAASRSRISARSRAGIGGALIGSTFGADGNGRLLATAGGAILGGVVGNSLGKSLDKADAQYANQNAQKALENNAAGQTTPWQNPAERQLGLGHA